MYYSVYKAKDYSKRDDSLLPSDPILLYPGGLRGILHTILHLIRYPYLTLTLFRMQIPSQ